MLSDVIIPASTGLPTPKRPPLLLAFLEWAGALKDSPSRPSNKSKKGYDVHGNIQRRLNMHNIAAQTKLAAAVANRAAIAALP